MCIKELLTYLNSQRKGAYMRIPVLVKNS